MLMNSPLFNEWVEEERKEAADKAAKEATKEAIKLSTRKHITGWLTEKFDFVPKSVRETINSIDDIVVLEELHKKIIKIETLEDFKTLLERAKKV